MEDTEFWIINYQHIGLRINLPSRFMTHLCKISDLTAEHCVRITSTPPIQ